MDYNQDQHNYQTYNPNTSSGPSERFHPFSVASMVCGIASVTLCCTGVLSLPLGALGILFAILSRRLGKSMSPASIAGIILSCTGIVFGLMTCGYLVYMILTDSDYRKAFEDSYEYYFEEYYDDSSSSIHYN